MLPYLNGKQKKFAILKTVFDLQRPCSANNGIDYFFHLQKEALRTRTHQQVMHYLDTYADPHGTHINKERIHLINDRLIEIVGTQIGRKNTEEETFILTDRGTDYLLNELNNITILK